MTEKTAAALSLAQTKRVVGGGAQNGIRYIDLIAAWFHFAIRVMLALI